MTFAEQVALAANIATATALVVAVLGGLVALQQLIDSRRQAAKASAIGFYEGYLRLAIEHPMLATPSLCDIDHRKEVIREPAIAGLTPKLAYDRYQWFVTFLLDTCDFILQMQPTQEWRATIERQISYHSDYLSRPDVRAVITETYSPELTRLLSRVVDTDRIERA